tara:strand:- start:2944 stop:3213 length:270 start_codon:yes stop_codon:yes gene_type:complete
MNFNKALDTSEKILSAGNLPLSEDGRVFFDILNEEIVRLSEESMKEAYKRGCKEKIYNNMLIAGAYQDVINLTLDAQDKIKKGKHLDDV